MLPLEITFQRRWVWALYSQVFSSPSLFLLHRTFILTHFYTPSSSSFPHLFTSVLAFCFLISNLSLSCSLILLSHPEPFPSAYQRRFTKSITFVVFLLLCAGSGILSVLSFCCGAEPFDKSEFLRLALRGFVFGTLFGVDYLHRKRWVLIFPVIQVSLCFYLLVLLMIESFLDWKCILNVWVWAHSNGPFVVLGIEFLGVHSAKGVL